MYTGYGNAFRTLKATFQWSSSAIPQDIIFPIVFPNNFYSLTMIELSSTGNVGTMDPSINKKYISLSGLKILNSGDECTYITIGD